MRLFDQVAHAAAPLLITDSAGLHVMPGTAEWAAAVAECPLRYVLDDEVADHCRYLVSAAGPAVAGLGTAGFPRLPFWVEWPEADGRRTGLMVTVGDTAPSASVEVFWEQEAGEPDHAQARAVLRLDRHADEPRDRGGRFALRPGRHPLASDLSFEIGAAWLGHFMREGSEAGGAAVERVAADVLSAVEMLLAFVVLLSARSAITLRPVDRSRLNRARQRNGRQRLLDHVTVALDLAAARRPLEHGPSVARNAPRTHQVRGHFVLRGDHLFWRRPHLRGSGGPPVRSRTVRVTSSLV